MRKLLLTAAALLLASCAGSSQPNYTVNEILLVNNSREQLREVAVTVPSTGRGFSCGNIAPLGICGDRFPPLRYQYNPIQVTWTYGNRTRRSDEFVVQVPANFSVGRPLRAVLEVSANGELAVFFQQESKRQ